MNSNKFEIKRAVFLSLGPVLALAVFTQTESWAFCLLAWMLVWWISDTIDVSYTALLPFCFALLGLVPREPVLRSYSSNTIFLFLGGMLLARAIEKVHLHRYAADLILKKVRFDPKHVMGALMASTASVSMFISNTAAGFVFAPLASDFSSRFSKDAPKNLRKVFLLSIAYASSIGGLGTILGSPPNALLVGFLAKEGIAPVGFFRWTLVGVPFAVLGCILLWWVFKFFYRSFFDDGVHLQEASQTIEALKASPSNLSTDQIKVLSVFSTAVAFWFIAPGLDLKFLGDSEIALAAGFVLFPLGILKIEDLRKIHWGILVLMGGGIALSVTLGEENIGQYLGAFGTVLDTLGPWGVTFAITLISILFTELMSNTAAVAILLSFVGLLFKELPSEVLINGAAVAFGGSLSFMLPAATPPNAMAYKFGQFKTHEMLSIGWRLNLIFAVLISVVCRLWVPVCWS